MKSLLLILSFITQMNSATQEHETLTTLTGKWTLICYENQSTKERSHRPKNYSPTQLTFTFTDDGKNGEIKGKTTSNRVTGNYRLEGNSIKVERFGGTRIGELEWGSDFWGKIKNTSSFEFRNDTLVIFYNNHTEAMLFSPAKLLEK